MILFETGGVRLQEANLGLAVIAELNAVLDENERLHEQVARLRDLLRRHGIDPDS